MCVTDVAILVTTAGGAIPSGAISVGSIQAVIVGVQCDGWSGTWDYTANAGSPEKPIDIWMHSKAGSNPRS